MARLTQRDVTEAALAIIQQSPRGIRFGEIHARIHALSPETPVPVVSASIAGIERRHPELVTKPERGLYLPAAGALDSAVAGPSDAASSGSLRESDLYPSLADWLTNDLEEVHQAVALGGSGLGGKWGTPDVVGVSRPIAGDVIRFLPEIVSCEVKIDANQTVVAFGQAVSYRLFSNRVYLVLPDSISVRELSRIEALCQLFGLGLVTFTGAGQAPCYVARRPAQSLTPDMYYANRFADQLKRHDQRAFATLFG